MLTAQRLRELFSYEPDTGRFVRKHACGRHSAGTVATAVDRQQGYLVVGIEGALYRQHRLAWLYMTGEWPVSEIDHVNGVRLDNRWINLRAASHSQNQANSRRSRNNTSGFKGVTRSGSRWVARVRKDGHLVHLGTFTTPEAAHDAYVEAATRLHGRFANGGF